MNTLDFSTIGFILLDIEGTCSDINFVKKVLFPYSARELRNYLSENRNNPEVTKALLALGKPDRESEIAELQQMIAYDVKHPSLKTLQGMIWKKGFEGGTFKAPLYEDVVPALKRWRTKSLGLGIYSSGSVPAQKLFWSFTEQGNLLEFFEAFFDLDMGNKKAAPSYRKIAAKLERNPHEILFLSDSEDEVRAAREAGCKAVKIVRDGHPDGNSAANFDLIM